MPLLSDIKKKSGVDFRPAGDIEIEQMRSLGAPEEALLFYRDHEPSECAEISGVRLWPIAEIIRENNDYMPGAVIQSWGYVVFATTVFGDAFCFDIKNANNKSHAPVVLIAHDLDWDNDETHRNIGSLTKLIAPSFTAFLNAYVAEKLDIQPLYPEWNP